MHPSGCFKDSLIGGADMRFQSTADQWCDEDHLSDDHCFYRVEKLQMPQRSYTGEKHIADETADHGRKSHQGSV